MDIDGFNKSFMYTDTVYISREETTIHEDKSTTKELIHAGEIKGRLSIKTPDTSVIVDNMHPTECIYKLFYSPNDEIRAGDILKIKKGEITHTFLASLPVFYPCHREVILTHKGMA